jgi:hypothetical protein
MLSELESSLRNFDIYRASELDDLKELMSIGHGWSRLVKEKLEKASTVQELEQLAKEGGMLRIEMPHIATVQSRYEDALKWLDETKDVLTATNIDQYEKWLHSARRISLQHERVDMINERIESAQKWRQSARSLFCKPAESLVDALGHRYPVHEQLNLQAIAKPRKDRPALDDVLALLKDGSELQTKVPEFAVIASIAEEATQWKARALAVLAECPLTELNFEVTRQKQTIQPVPQPIADPMDVNVANVAQLLLLALDTSAGIKSCDAVNKDSMTADSHSGGGSYSGGARVHPASTRKKDCCAPHSSCDTTIEWTPFADEADATVSPDSPAKALRPPKEEHASWLAQQSKITELLQESHGSAAHPTIFAY